MLLDILYKIGVTLITSLVIFVVNFFIISRSKAKLIIFEQVVTDDYKNFIKSFVAYILEAVGLLATILYINFDFTVLESVFKSAIIIILLPIADFLLAGTIGWIFKFKDGEATLGLFCVFVILEFIGVGGMATYLMFTFGLL